MKSEWLPQETTTHQDHVIAHVVGATVLGYFIVADAASFFSNGDRRRLVLEGEEGNLKIETSLKTAQFQVSEI